MRFCALEVLCFSIPSLMSVKGNFSLLLFGVSLWLFQTSLPGQLGVTPTLNGMYFNNHRARAMDVQAEADYSRGRSSYQFDRGYYRAPLGPSDVVGPSDANAMNSQVYQGAGPGQPFSSVTAYSRTDRQSSNRYFASGGADTSAYGATGPHVADYFNSGYYNFKVAGIPFVLGAGALVEYNDNLFMTETDKESALAGGVWGSIQGTYNFSQLQSLSFSLTGGYTYFWDHPEEDGGEGYYRYQSGWRNGGIPGGFPGGFPFSLLNLSDGSGISLDILVGEVGLRIYDRFTTRNISFDDFSFQTNDMFSQFLNTAGLDVAWSVNQAITLTTGYSRTNEISLDEDFEYLDNGRHTLYGDLGWSPSQTWTAGVNVTSSWIDYNDNERFNNEPLKRDARTFDVGLYVNGPITVTENTTISMGAGSQIIDFEESLNSEGDPFDDYYYYLTLTNQLNTRFSHDLTFRHQADLGVAYDYVMTNSLRYGFQAIGYRGSRISGSAYYTWKDNSGGLDDEDFERFGFDLSAGHQVTEWLYFGMGYNFERTFASEGENGSDDHRFYVNTSYPLSDRMTLGMAYNFWMVEGEGDITDFEQNRTMLYLNYDF